MPYFAGLRGTGSFGTDERPKSFREAILFMNPNGSAPLFALTSKSKTKPVNDPEFSWWEEVQSICRLIVNGAHTNVQTTITVNAGALELIPGDVLMVEPAVEIAAEANERMRVVSVTNDTTFVVVRGVAGTSGAAISSAQALVRIGNSQSEGNLSVSTSSNNPTKFTNYTQIFKTPYQITKTGLVPDYRTGDPKKNEQKRKSFQHAEKIEQALMWGRAHETTDATNGNMPLRHTMGLRSFITTNRTIFGATPTEDTFLAAITPVFDYESEEAGNERLILAGNTALNILNKLAKNNTSTRLNMKEVITFYGMRLQRWEIPQGTLYIKSHPLMNVHPVFTKSMFVVNPAGITYRPLKGRDTKLEKDIQPNDADYIKDQWLTECGFEFHLERSMAYLGNVA